MIKKIHYPFFLGLLLTACQVKDHNEEITRKPRMVDSMAQPGIKETATIADLNSFELKGSEVLYHLVLDKGEAYFTAHAFEELARQELSTSDELFFQEAGQRLISEKKFPAALALYQLFTKEFPGVIIAWNDLGEVYLAMKETDKAKACFEQALRINPDNERAKRMLKKIGST